MGVNSHCNPPDALTPEVQRLGGPQCWSGWLVSWPHCGSNPESSSLQQVTLLTLLSRPWHEISATQKVRLQLCAAGCPQDVLLTCQLLRLGSTVQSAAWCCGQDCLWVVSSQQRKLDALDPNKWWEECAVHWRDFPYHWFPLQWKGDSERWGGVLQDLRSRV